MSCFSVFCYGGIEDVGKMTAENKVVVDRSDLIPKVLTMNVGDEFCGVVAHIQTPEDFFCQQLQSGRKQIFLICPINITHVVQEPQHAKVKIMCRFLCLLFKM